MTMSINGTNGLTFNDASTQNTAATGFGFKNRIINGAMVIDQRNSGASVTASGSFPVDRFAIYQSTASKFTAQQNAGAITPPIGFSNYLGVTSSSAYAITTTDQFLVIQRIEGFNFSDMAWGTASAATATLSFKVYSSLTGTFGGSLQNSASNRCYPFSFSIPVANTWTTVSVTIAGDTTGTWVGGTNGVGVLINFSLGTGATYSGTAGAWTGSSFITSVTGAVSVVGTSGATFYVTGVQLEKGSTATTFDYRPYGTELALCQRYLPVYVQTPAQAGSYASVAGLIPVATNVEIGFTHQVAPRTPPTGIYVSSPSHFTMYNGVLNVAPSGITMQNSTLNNITLNCAVTGGSVSQACALYVNNTLAQIYGTGCEL